jgi:hypothetical protein
MLSLRKVRYIRAACRYCHEMISCFACQDIPSGNKEEKAEIARKHAQDFYGLDPIMTKREVRVDHYALLR